MLGQRWGVTAEEVRLAYGCDAAMPDAEVELWRGISIDAPPGVVWRWVRQLRLAPYSYDLIDNAGRRSPRTLRELPDPVPGEPFTTVAGRRSIGRVVATDPGRELTAEIMGAAMSYLVLPSGGGTRLLLKVVMRRRTWRSSLLALGDWPMARRQLLNFKRLAETAPS